MSGPPTSDRSLLERLNALKPSAVTLDRAPIQATAVQNSAGEDALSARLRSLRNLPTTVDDGGGGNDGDNDGRAAGLSTAGGPQLGVPASRAGSAVASPAPRTAPPEKGTLEGAGDDIDPLFPADDKALDDLLEEVAEGRGGGDLDLGRPAFPAIAFPEAFDPATEAERVSALLDGLRSGPDLGTDDADADEDDSEGEVMGREVQSILSRAGDAAELDRRRHDELGALPEETDQPRPPFPGTSSRLSPDPSTNAARRGRGAGGTSGLLETDDDSNDGDPNDGDPNDGDPNDGFSLPPAPSTQVGNTILPDLPRGPNFKDPAEEDDADFENDISARMARLAATDADPFLGLPSAPRFQPGEERDGGGSSSRAAWKKSRAGNTDKDQKPW